MKIYTILSILIITFVTSCNHTSEKNNIIGNYSCSYKTESLYEKRISKHEDILNITYVKDNIYGLKMKSTVIKNGNPPKTQTVYYEYSYNSEE